MLSPPCHTPGLESQRGVRKDQSCSQELPCPLPVLPTGVLCRMKSGAVSNDTGPCKTLDHGARSLGCPNRGPHTECFSHRERLSHTSGARSPRSRCSRLSSLGGCEQNLLWASPSFSVSLVISGVPGLVDGHMVFSRCACLYPSCQAAW